jgi:hypothetical protein
MKTRHRRLLCYVLCGIFTVGLAACGGSNSSSSANATPTQQSGSLPLVVSDAASDDWATVGVQILSVALVPQGGGSNVTIYTAPSPAPMVNLEELDQLGEILGNVSVPVGTYTGAVLTVGGNPGNVLLVTSADPETGFAGAPSTTIPSADIQIQGTTGSTGSLSVPISVNFAAPLSVTSSSNNALDLEFDLSNPAFIIAHVPPGSGGTTMWAVNFNGPVHRHPVHDMRRLVLRHLYGSVSSVASDGGSLTVTRDYQTLPIVSPETAVAGSQSVNILVDSTNGTLFYDVDTGTRSTLTSFSAVSALSAGEYLRIAARYQEDGTLVATRIWASSSFNNVWLSPEGHVLDVNTTADTITVVNEQGQPVQLAVNADTQFYFQNQNNTPIGNGAGFLANLHRGFKIETSVNPLAPPSSGQPWVAQSVEIETAAFGGQISGANTAGFTYMATFPEHPSDSYVAPLDYISSTTANGYDAQGNPISGFDWWNFAYPTLINDGSSAVGEFVSATSNSIPARGVTRAVWGDPSNPSGWAAPMTVLLPVPLPLATVTNPLSANSFQVTTGGSSPATYTVDISATTGQATLVYQVDRNSAGIVTVSPVDITTAAGMQTLTSDLADNTPVKVYGVPTTGGALQTYVLLCFTGVAPAN